MMFGPEFDRFISWVIIFATITLLGIGLLFGVVCFSGCQAPYNHPYLHNVDETASELEAQGATCKQDGFDWLCTYTIEKAIEVPVEKVVVRDNTVYIYVDREVEVEVVKEVEVIKEVVRTVYLTQPVEVPVDRIVYVDRPVEVETIVEKEVIVEVPIETVREVEVIVEVPVEVIREVIREIEVIKEVEKIVEVPVEVEKEVIVEVEKEVIKEVTRPFSGEVALPNREGCFASCHAVIRNDSFVHFKVSVCGDGWRACRDGETPTIYTGRFY